MKIPLLFRLPIFYLLFTFSLFSCSEHIDSTLDDTPNVTPKFGPNFTFFTDSNLYQRLEARRSSSNSDSFIIKEVKKDNGNLKIIVNYTGGCGKHSFDVVWDGVVNLSKDGKEKVNLLVKHNGNNDSCEAAISEAIVINLNTYSNNLVDIKNTVFTVSNGSSIEMVTSSN